jgi:cold-inducible RNA-binding protein
LKEEIMETKIYVGNLSYTTTEEELKQLFSQAGTVASVAMIKDRDTGQSKGFAFIEMSNQAEAEKAISMFNGKSLGSRELKVNLARPREERGSGGYGGRGGGAGGNRRGGSGGGQRRY